MNVNSKRDESELTHCRSWSRRNIAKIPILFSSAVPAPACPALLLRRLPIWPKKKRLKQSFAYRNFEKTNALLGIIGAVKVPKGGTPPNAALEIKHLRLVVDQFVCVSVQPADL